MYTITSWWHQVQTEESVRKSCSWSAKDLQEGELKQQILTDQLKSKQMWSCMGCNLVAPKDLHWAVEEGKVERKALVKVKAEIAPNHTHFCWPDWEAKQLLNKLSWQISASSNCFRNLSSSDLFICLWGTILFTKTIVIDCIDVYSW